MADTKSELRTEVRSLTDYSVADLPKSDLNEVIDIAQREAKGVANATVTDWYSGDAELALFWTACLFTKIKGGEIDSADMSLGDMDIEALRAAGDNPVIWHERAMSYSSRLKSEGSKYGIRSASRGPSRSYGSTDSGSSL